MNVRYVVTREEIAAFEGVDKIHFLNPGARRLNKSLGDLAGLTNLGFHLIEVQPGHAWTGTAHALVGGRDSCTCSPRRGAGHAR